MSAFVLAPQFPGQSHTDALRRARDLAVAADTEFLCATHPVGSIDDCVVRLTESIERTGIRRYALLVEGTGDYHRTLETVAGVGAELVPSLTQVL